MRNVAGGRCSTARCQHRGVTAAGPSSQHSPISLRELDALGVERLKGVGDVTIFGAQDYSMRVWLRPDRMAQLGLTTSEVAAAISAQNAQNAQINRHDAAVVEWQDRQKVDDERRASRPRQPRLPTRHP